MSTTLVNAVSIVNGHPTTTSIKVSEIFGKQHKNVIRDINRLDCSSNFCKLNFEPTSISVQQPRGGTRKTKAYNITKDGFVFLAMGYTGKQAAEFKEAYIETFNKMEAKLREQENLKQLVDTSSISLISNPLSGFIEDVIKIEFANQGWISRKNVYTRYVKWCYETSSHSYSNRKFWPELRKSASFEEQKSNGTRCVRFLNLAQNRSRFGTIVEYRGQRVISNSALTVFYQVNRDAIWNRRNYHRDVLVEDRDFFNIGKMEIDTLRFKFPNVPWLRSMSKRLILWTETGAKTVAAMLCNPYAVHAFNQLEKEYFKYKGDNSTAPALLETPVRELPALTHYEAPQREYADKVKIASLLGKAEKIAHNLGDNTLFGAMKNHIEEIKDEMLDNCLYKKTCPFVNDCLWHIKHIIEVQLEKNPKLTWEKVLDSMIKDKSFVF